MPSGLGSSSPAAVLQEALENSSRLVDRHLQEDRCVPDLSELLNVPSHSIFQPHIHFLLVLATPVDVVILGLSFPKAHTGLNDSMSGAMQLLPDPLYSIPTDNTYLLAITSTDVGRVFMAGKDGCLYEIAYQAEAGWFSQRCRKINHSKSSLSFLIPSLLQFSFSEDGIFQPHIHFLLVLATPVDVVILGLSFPKAHTGLNDSMSGAMQLLPDPLYSIPTDNTYLLAITSTDVGRVFMAGKDGCLYEIAYQAEAGWFSQRCRKINHSKSSLSFLIPSLLQFSFSEDDSVVQIAVDNSRNILYTRSEKGVLQVYDLGADGQGMSRVAAMSQSSIISAAGNIARTIDRSVFKPIVQIAVIDRSESSDCQLLAVTHAGVRLYFSTIPFAPPNAKFCLFLQMTVNVDGHSWALCSIEETESPRILTPLNKDLIPVTDTPLVVQQHSVPPQKFVLLSAQRRNIWDGSLSAETILTKGSQTVTIRFSSPANLQQRLLGFMRPDGSSSQQVQQELQRKYHTEAQAYEKASLQAMQQLIHRSYQTLALWKLLCDHQFSLIVSEMPKEFQDQIKAVSFKDVVVSGLELSGALITAIINVYIKDSACVDTVSAHLRDICPLLYSSDDSICSKANELLQGSRQIQSKLEKERTLKESLRLYQQISHHTDLPLVCSQYRQVRFYEGVLELCLTAADKKDPQKLGLHFYRNGEPEEDSSGLQAFQQRLCCYKCITDTMQELVNQSKAAPQSPSVPKQPGPPVMTSDPNMLSNEDSAAHFEQMLGLAQRSQDELFHIALYNCLIQADLTDKLLEVNSLYLEDHLMHMIKQDQSKVRNMDLLWRYYEKNRSFGKAAHVLARLADMHSTEISLKQRLEYISRAILSAKSSSCVSSLGADGEFLHELEEKMEVVRIQVQIQESLRRQYSQHPSVQGAITQMDSELMDITKLYGEFADHFRLSECKLAIIHCAGHSDPILVHSLWQEIVEKELSDSVAMSPADRMRALSLKLVSLGKLYAGTPRYFPLDFLVKFLEQEVCRLHWDVGFVTFTMQEIGVQLPRLLEVYDQLFKTRDPCWQRVKKPLHLVECIHVLLSGYVNDPSRVPTYDRRRFTNACLDNICGYLVELQSLSPNAALQDIIHNFKCLQTKLEKLH
ncbi:nuclear pore complex protein Nup155-like [Sinocyclocheilus grahami]|uniref:nuclear pore complex protein Nup155-like n=1 Tax=Sinocyclocheilus grahami TaxID=75366 RepID=UPI0007ACA46D|nr:PREDICTED: nuclear pore complex protein Nup155-like [Sinocyclocheilus grahami]